MNAKTAGLVAIAASGGALTILLIYLPAVMFKIHEINAMVKQDSEEFRHLSKESWMKITEVYGPDIGRRIRRQASKTKTEGVKPAYKQRDQPYGSSYESDSFGSSSSHSHTYGNSGYGGDRYGKSEAVVTQNICSNPAEDAIMEKATQCGCNANRNCPAGPAGPPGQSGLDGTPGQPGRPGKRGQPGNAPPVTVICENDDEVGSDGSEAGYVRVKRGAYGETSSYAKPSGYSRSGYGSSHDGNSYGKNCCRVCPHGPVGPSGPPGSPGGCGPKGFPGPPGRNGENGRDGNSGSSGKPGEPGAPGKMGGSGSKGQNGVKGIKGAPGKKGQSGESGQKGPDGFAGKDGQPGLDGGAGNTGGPGNSGDKGQDGKPGPSGIAGEPGQDAHYCPCPERGSGNSGVVNNQGSYDQGGGSTSYQETSSHHARYGNQQAYHQPASAPQYDSEPPSYQFPTYQNQGSGYVQRAHGAKLGKPEKTIAQLEKISNATEKYLEQNSTKLGRTLDKARLPSSEKVYLVEKRMPKTLNQSIENGPNQIEETSRPEKQQSPVLGPPENFLPPVYDNESETVKTSPYFSRLAKLKRLRQMALVKAKS